MRFLSVCSGIEAASAAWKPLGWECVGMSEIEKFPRAVLKHHYPDVPLHGDFTEIEEKDVGTIELLVGGTPCQSFSIAGLRKGLADDRGNLALEFCRLALRTSPKWIVWENVPGVLSSNGGRDFGAFLGALAECGYGFAYRVLDAQFVRVESHPFAVPQRRRRVFVVGHLGDWRPPAAVLLERESMQGHHPPRRETGQGIAGTLSSRTTAGGGLGTDFELSGGVVSHCLNAGGMGRQDWETETLVPFDTTQVTSPDNRSSPKPGGPCHTLGKGQHPPAIAFSSFDDGQGAATGVSPTMRTGTAIAFSCKDSGDDVTENATPTLRSMSSGQVAVSVNKSVRRLTPRECERLQGFPDDYTLVEYRKKPAADGPRYKSLGNSMAVNVMSWIGQRIKEVESWS